MPGVEALGDLTPKLGKYKTGKACLSIRRLEDVDRKVLEAMIKRSVELMTPRRVESPPAVGAPSRRGDPRRRRPVPQTPVPEALTVAGLVELRRLEMPKMVAEATPRAIFAGRRIGPAPPCAGARNSPQAQRGSAATESAD